MKFSVKRLGAIFASSVIVSPLVGLANASDAAAADPLLGAPAVGSCFNLSVREHYSSTYEEPAIACAGKHTSRVIAVGTFPADVSMALTDDAAGFVGKACFAALDKASGAGVRGTDLSAYEYAWFIPTDEQITQGARWFRCDLIVYQGRKLGALPGKTKLGKFPYKNKVSRCLTGKKLIATTCDRSHSYRATGAKRVSRRPYPSKKQWISLGRKLCRKVVTSRTFRFTWSTEFAWTQGRRLVTCYSKTTK